MNKKTNLRLTLLLFAFAPLLTLNGQVLNAGFETARSNGTAANWETRLMIAAPIGAEDSCNTDAFCTLTNDAYSGKKALLLQNISCYGELVYGRIFATDDIPAYGPSIPFAGRPDFFSFYYKFFPNAGEGIRMEAILNDAGGAMIGTADTFFYPGTVNTYTRVQVPVQYWDATQPERLFLRFNFVDSLGGNTDMQVGSRLFLDEISTGKQVTGIGERQSWHSMLQCYPVPAGDWVDIRMEDSRQGERYALQLTDITGKVIYRKENVVLDKPLSIDLRGQVTGIYIVKAGNASRQLTAKFVHIR